MNDEKNGTHYAKLLHEKGFDTVYLLTTGIEGFLESNYELVEGYSVPEKSKIKAADAKGIKKSMTMTTSSKMTTGIIRK